MTDDKALRFRDANNTILSHNTDFDLGMVSDGVIKLDSEGDIQIESDDDVIIKFDANSTNTATAKLSIQNTPLGEIAHFDKDGNLQLDGDIQIDGNTVTFGNGALMNNSSADLLIITESTVQFAGDIFAPNAIQLGHASANTLTASGGDLSIEGNVLYRAGGTDTVSYTHLTLPTILLV